MLPRKGLLGDPILSQRHGLGPRPHRAKASQIFETRCGNVLEFGRDGSRHFSQLPQGRLVPIRGLNVAVGKSFRGAELIGVKDDYFVSHSASRGREHPSQLAAPEQSQR